MRALLTPLIQRELNLVLFRPGTELLPLFMSGRVLISNEPNFMKSLPAGALVDAQQTLAEDPTLTGFFTDERVIAAAGQVDRLESWLQQRDAGCQWPDKDFHMTEMTSLRYGKGAVRLCWHHDHKFRGLAMDRLGEIARQNLAEWILDTVRIAFQFPEHHQITLPELCWWAAQEDLIQAIPQGSARRVLKWRPLETPSGVMHESDIEPIYSATDVLVEQAKPVLALAIDPEPPESFMLRPKPRRWVNENYTRWVKTQICAGCGNQADDPHHITGYGLGGMGTKPHDFFVIPLCRQCHNELHRDTHAFEERHGSQLEMLVRTQDRALSLGVISTGKLK
ncbi:DUF968 domain-containing protein [Sodalis ligni]|uniref:Uncharacterized protein DUF968 n=1 Tax=Sodalis ligni TaxID=2697027 RepID=A0A4V2Q3I6_9GAMM|nr:DUF968 domain-containing protein [Sodalis ligni]TCL06878.1 uncharacterized protein DUF968 [Sodalis ligni]